MARSALLLIAFILCGAANTATALLTQECQGCWRLSGTITDDDLKQIKAIADRVGSAPENPAFFNLDSDGGDIDIAMAVGRQLRRMSATAGIARIQKCLSSCVIVLAGAVTRLMGVMNNIGIHRPYSLRTDQREYSTIQEEQRALARRTKAYLEEMNVSPGLYDAMMRIPPEKMRFLSESELEEFGLTATDPAYQELMNASGARYYGLSKLEYLRRKAQGEYQCQAELSRGGATGDMSGYSTCLKGIMRGK